MPPNQQPALLFYRELFDGRPLIHCVSAFGHKELLSYLAREGTPPAALNSRDANDNTPLGLAMQECQKNSSSTVRSCLSATIEWLTTNTPSQSGHTIQNSQLFLVTNLLEKGDFASS